MTDIALDYVTVTPHPPRRWEERQSLSFTRNGFTFIYFISLFLVLIRCDLHNEEIPYLAIICNNNLILGDQTRLN